MNSCSVSNVPLGNPLPLSLTLMVIVVPNYNLPSSLSLHIIKWTLKYVREKIADDDYFRNLRQHYYQIGKTGVYEKCL